MIGYLRRITVDDIVKMQKKPTIVRQLLRGPYDMKAAIRDQVRGKASPKRAAMEAAYARSKQISDELRRSDRAPGPITPEEHQQIMKPLRDAGAFGEEVDVLNLEKYWHTLHFLLTGRADDLAYGSARYLSPDEVVQIAAALQQLSKQDLARRFDLQAMMASTIYACRDAGELELAQEYFAQVQQFYSEAASRGNGMLLYLK